MDELGLCYVEVYIRVTFYKVKAIEKAQGVMGKTYIFPFKFRVRVINP